MRLIHVARSPLVAVSPPVLLILGGRGAMGVSTPDVLPSSASSSSFSGWYAVQSLDQWRSITSNRFVLNMVWGHHLQLRSCAPLFHTFWQFSVKVAAAHHHIIQEVDELLSKGAVEPSSGGAGFYSSMFVVLSVMAVFCPYLTLSGLIIICIYLLLRCLLSDICGSLFSMVTLPSSLIYRMFVYIFLLLSIIIISYDLFGMTCLISRKFYLLGWPQPLGFHSLH